MYSHYYGGHADALQETSRTEKFSEKLDELEHCDDDGQKQKIEEINEMIFEMTKEEFKSVFTEELFDKMLKMIEEKKLSMENAMLLLKHIGYCKKMKSIQIWSFNHSQLSKRIMKIIIEEEKKKEEEKEEKLLVDLCECYISLYYLLSSEMISICVPCLLKVALKKEENDEAQKEVEMALLALSCIDLHNKLDKELYLKETTKIIEYHRRHRNLTRLGYLCIWEFLIKRMHFDTSLEEVFVDEFHFARDARRELEELTRCVDSKREKKEEMSKEEAKEKLILFRLLQILDFYFGKCQLWHEEFTGLLSCIVKLVGAVKDDYRDIGNECIHLLIKAVENRTFKVDDLLKCKAIDLVLEEIQKPTLDDGRAGISLRFFDALSLRMNNKKKYELEEPKRKWLKRRMIEKLEEVKREELKRRIFEKMEEEGFEDIVTSFHKTLEFFQSHYDSLLPLNVADYFVNERMGHFSFFDKKI
ncbi:uncharacterized protein MONOS_4890 [Monocercomonoides exilis]|uniref:uncharacterized protein n=1 Tax=Monocercomonoides exilis TaxID=2049356 RepID=UPI00355A729A|nr:hypothetical protein MONOS_4890 [Monocercomonoides exilis]|eukprot:MONOS_4890.1-p1 / transcript=MONOS_4890.1 / gene=MONOS_4890 / organism=Monocercomonoides_exilis_PA203 / gene_product=unspecified product / transcript_product=unspecified product / location=Mono_scaffold00136:102479-104009(-) / protein_length=473 / sequence_SO=supercontig / SO=protein_coding / is_pseudo=false